jgi:hypothetical protein
MTHDEQMKKDAIGWYVARIDEGVGLGHRWVASCWENGK